MQFKTLVPTFSVLALIGVACGGSNNTTGTGGNGGKPASSGGTTGTSGGASGTAGASGGSGGTTGASGGAAGTGSDKGGSGGGYPTTPILGTLNTFTTIGSTIDPNNDPAIDPTGSGANPYGLAIAPVTAGLITAGDLVVCNFNNGPNAVDAGGAPAPNTQGQGTTMVGLHPAAGSNPYHIAQSAKLLGCSSLSIFPDDSIAATAFSAAMVPVVDPSGTLSTPFAAHSFGMPWGSAYAAAANGQPAALYVSNATGSITRVTLDNVNSSNAPTGFDQIITGFCVSGAVQGSTDSLHAPSGLTYDASIDTLYVVDTSSYSVVAFAHVSSIPANGITVNGGNCAAAAPTAIPTFSGPSIASAVVIASPNSPNGGQQLNAPISAALLLNGNVVVGNADQDLMQNDAGTNENLLFEVSPTAGIVGVKQLDPGAPGALFGIAAEADGSGHQLIYFNDDNDNTVKVLSK